MVGDFFGLVAQFAHSVEDEELGEDPVVTVARMMDSDGKEAFSRELRAISLLESNS